MSEQKPRRTRSRCSAACGARSACAAGHGDADARPRELDKRIADLRSIEAWLNMNSTW